LKYTANDRKLELKIKTQNQLLIFKINLLFIRKSINMLKKTKIVIKKIESTIKRQKDKNVDKMHKTELFVFYLLQKKRIISFQIFKF